MCDTRSMCVHSSVPESTSWDLPIQLRHRASCHLASARAEQTYDSTAIILQSLARIDSPTTVVMLSSRGISAQLLGSTAWANCLGASATGKEVQQGAKHARREIRCAL